MIRFAQTSLFLLFAACAFLAESLPAQEAVAYHAFRNKNGQQISALLLGVSPDRQQMKIRREDGREFELVINQLSLDDQQYIKDWLKEDQPAAVAAKTDFRLELNLSRHYGETLKDRSDPFLFEEKETLFRVKVRNLSRDTLESARLEYAYVWDDYVTFYEMPDRGKGFSAPDQDEERRVKRTGESNLEPVLFNRDITIETAPLKIDKVIYSGDPYREDEFIGLKVRILAADGTVIAEEQSGTSALNSLTWDDIVALPDPRVIR